MFLCLNKLLYPRLKKDLFMGKKWIW